MAKTQFNVEQIKTEAKKPLFAVAGATELAVELARGYATEAQKATQERFAEVHTRVSDVQARVTKVEFEPKSLQAQARTRFEARVAELQKEAKEAQARFEARVADLQKEAKEFPARFEARLNEALEELNATYADLARRGEKFVAAIRKDGVKAVTSVKPARKVARKAPATKTTAKKAPAKKASAKKAPAKKAVKAS
jgi:hypothetical protein